MTELLSMLTVVAVVGSGLVAGIFFAFSTFVMRALGRRPQHEGIASMQAINVTVLNPWFFAVFFGTAAVCAIVAILTLLNTTGARRFFLFAACALYLFGCILVTMAFNVPLNNRLASVRPDSPEARALWSHYLTKWTLWNHVRTGASLVAASLFAMAL